MYRPEYVPVGEDQVAHVEITREIARRFNNIYGRETDFEAKVEGAVKRLGVRNASQYEELRRKFQEHGDAEALARARAMVESGARLTVADRERLLGYLEGGGRAQTSRTVGTPDQDSEGARPRWPKNVEVLRQHDWTA